MTTSRFQRLRPFLVPALLLAAAARPARAPVAPSSGRRRRRGPDRPRRERVAARLHHRRAAFAREAAGPADGRVEDARESASPSSTTGPSSGPRATASTETGTATPGDAADALPGRLHQQAGRRAGGAAPRRAGEAGPRRGRQRQARIVEGPRERLHQDRESHPAAAPQPLGRPDRPRLRRVRGRRARARRSSRCSRARSRPTATPVRVDVVPGTIWRYSGGGYTVAQQLMTDVTGRPFPELMAELVLKPVGMTDSTYEQPLPEAAARRRRPAATPRTASSCPAAITPIPRWPRPGCGRRRPTWPSSCSRSQRARRGKSAVLSQALALEMTTVQKPGYGLGLSLDGFGKMASFGHGGSNEGFKCQMTAFFDGGRGAVIMTNGDQGGFVGRRDPAGRRPRVRLAVLQAASRRRSWRSNPRPWRPLKDATSSGRGGSST